MTTHPHTTLHLRPHTANRIDVIGDVIHGTEPGGTGETVPGASIAWREHHHGEPCVTVTVGIVIHRIFNRDGRAVVEALGERISLAELERVVAKAREAADQ